MPLRSPRCQTEFFMPQLGLMLPILGIRSSASFVRAGAFLGRGDIGIETPPRLGFGARHVGPTDLLRVGENAGLNSLVFAGFHQINYMAQSLPYSFFRCCADKSKIGSYMKELR